MDKSEARHAGITRTGQDDDDELPLIANVYRQYKKNRDAWIRKQTQRKPETGDDALSRVFGVRFAVLEMWDPKAAQVAQYRASHPDYVPMGRFIEEVTEPVDPRGDPEREWPVYGVNNVDGVFLSQRQTGSEFHSNYKRIREGWFFHNPTRSAVGSFGRVPQVPEDAITSPEYQVWRVRGGILPEYVEILLKTEEFRRLVRIHRVGAVKERLYVRNLAEIVIPVPSEDVQRDLILRYRNALTRLDEARGSLREAVMVAESTSFGAGEAADRSDPN